jgi:nickel superoxide dismutase
MHKVIKALDSVLNFDSAQAHCDVPCGVYDPIPTQIAAMTVARMTDTLLELEAHEVNDHGGERGIAYQNKATRMVNEKERSAELVKHEIRIIWGDMFKAPQFEKYPQLHELVHTIMLLTSKCKQNVDQEASRELMTKCNEFAQIFWEVKGINTKTVKYHCKPNLDMVFPEL